jgi:hypothetical protein
LPFLLVKIVLLEKSHLQTLQLLHLLLLLLLRR